MEEACERRGEVASQRDEKRERNEEHENDERNVQSGVKKREVKKVSDQRKRWET